MSGASRVDAPSQLSMPARDAPGHDPSGIAVAGSVSYTSARLPARVAEAPEDEDEKQNDDQYPSPGWHGVTSANLNTRSTMQRKRRRPTPSCARRRIRT